MMQGEGLSVLNLPGGHPTMLRPVTRDATRAAVDAARGNDGLSVGRC